MANQFFQVAGVSSHAESMNTVAMFNRWPYNKYLDKPINDSLADGTVRVRGIDHTIVMHNQADYKPIPNGDNQALFGFFQSDKYFYSDAFVVNLFRPARDFMGKLNGIWQHIYYDKIRIPIAVHVRRTDYLQHSDSFPVLPESYYRKAMTLMKAQYPGCEFIFFSDDIPWCKETFGNNEPGIHYSEGHDDITDMYLMAKCRHHIIANSSYSWWGAWLRKIFYGLDLIHTVIAPAVWAGPTWRANSPTDKFQDFYCKGWTII